MRMRKKKNLIPRMERCGDRLIREPYSMPGKWRELMPQARELRLELGCGKGRFTAGTAAISIHAPRVGSDCSCFPPYSASW